MYKGNAVADFKEKKLLLVLLDKTETKDENSHGTI